jgi:hypothetical protein
MKKIHLITSTYNDLHKFTWKDLIDFSEVELFLYRKCDDLEIGQSRINGEFIDIPNYGSCDYVFFYHIVNNYDNLADYNIFTKMNLYEDYFTNFPEVFNNAKYYDFYQGGGAPISQIWYNEETKHLIDLPSKYDKVPMNISLTKDKKPKHDGYSTYNGTEFEYAANSDGQIDWFNYLYGGDDSPGEICTYQWGPCFSVSKNLILRHSKSVYKHFLDIFHPFNSWDYEVGKKFYGTDDIKYQTWGVGRGYHDELLRFYRVFFTYGLNDADYKINQI